MFESFAEIYRSANLNQDAIDASESSAEIMRTLTSEYPNNSTFQFTFAVSLVRNCRMHATFSDTWEGNFSICQTSYDAINKYVIAHPDNMAARYNLAISLTYLGVLNAGRGETDKAENAYQTSIAVIRELEDASPNDVGIRQQLLIDLSFLGELKGKKGDFVGALAAYREALDGHRKLASKQPTDMALQFDVALLVGLVGEMQLKTGDRLAGLAAFDESIDVRRKLVALDPSNLERQEQLSSFLRQTGEAKLLAGDQSGALAAYQEGISLDRAVLVSHPGNDMALRELRETLERFGELKSVTEDYAGAVGAYREGLDVASKWWDGHPASKTRAIAKFWLMRGYLLLSDSQLQLGNKADALAAVQEGLDFVRKIASEAVGVRQAQDDLVTLWRAVANVKLRVGDPVGALAASKEGLEIARSLAEDKTDNNAQRSLVDVLSETAVATLLVKDYASSLRLSEEAISLEPERLWLQATRAHALMLLGRADEARTIYLKYRGKSVDDKQIWEQAIESDFKELRKNGINNQLMENVETDYRFPTVNTPTRKD
jgi:tetratricopeptide (TPR) repeat protein